MAFVPQFASRDLEGALPLGTICRISAGCWNGQRAPARPRARQAEAPRPVTIYSATRQALAMMVRVGLAPVAVGKGEPSTT